MDNLLNEMRYGEYTVVEPMAHGMRGAVKVQFRESGRYAVYKPSDSGGSELAYALAQHIGFEGLVPPTVMRNGGSMIEWVEGAELGTAAIHDATLDFREITWFDRLTAHNDRHNANWMAKPDGQIIAIDNESAFLSDREGLYYDIHERVREEAVSDAHYEVVERLLTHSQHWPQCLKSMEREQVASFYNRLVAATQITTYGERHF